MISDIFVFQHGHNPEHVLRITGKEAALEYSRAHEDAESYMNRRVDEWVESIHAFEQEGKWFGQPE